MWSGQRSVVRLSPLGARVFARSMRYFSLALRTLSRVSRSCNSGNICKSSRVCPVWLKCSATPDLSCSFCLMSLRCSNSLSLTRRLVCPMYWQLVLLLDTQRLHCIKYMTLRDLQSSLCRMSYVVPLLVNVQVLVPLVMCLQVMQRPVHVCIPSVELELVGVTSLLILSCFSLERTRYCLRLDGWR